MPNQVVNAAMLKCSMGLAPGTLVVLPKNMMMVGNQPAANIMDHIPMVNILPFGMCRSPANPTVAAATAAAMGGADADALYPQHSCALDARLDHHDPREHACAHQRIEVYVRVGQYHRGCESWTSHNGYTVRVT